MYSVFFISNLRFIIMYIAILALKINLCKFFDYNVCFYQFFIYFELIIFLLDDKVLITKFIKR